MLNYKKNHLTILDDFGNQPRRSQHKNDADKQGWCELTGVEIRLYITQTRTGKLYWINSVQIDSTNLAVLTFKSADGRGYTDKDISSSGYCLLSRFHKNIMLWGDSPSLSSQVPPFKISCIYVYVYYVCAYKNPKEFQKIIQPSQGNLLEKSVGHGVDDRWR